MSVTRQFVVACLVFVLTAGFETGSAIAKGKVFCRGYAEDFANGVAGPSDSQAGIAADSGTGIGFGLTGDDTALTGVAPTASGDSASDEWRQAYRAAYSDCRAS